MPQLRIERVPISGLQFSGFDHMHLVLEPDRVENSTYPQDEWFVLEGTFEGPEATAVLGTLGGNSTTTLPELNGGLSGADLEAAIGTPGARGSRVLSAPGDTQVAWTFMSALARDIDGQRLPYQSQLIASKYKFNLNSSSVVATLLHSVGLDVGSNLPYGIDRSNGWQTLIGTSGDDTLRIESTFINLVGGPGSDRFYGTNINDQYERFAGGTGDDEFFWSEGSHTYHGGQLRLDYAQDGTDTIDYTDVGEVRFDINPGRVPHLGADIIATHATGQDYLLSIERVTWGAANDTVEVGEGLDLLNENVLLDLGDQASLDAGDTIDFSFSDGAVEFVAATNDGIVFVRSHSETQDRAGLWITSAETIIATPHDDQAYIGWQVRQFDGGDGDDLIDVRDITAFAGGSPNGYDVEIIGGAGNDTIVIGNGRVFADGGSGEDRFIVSELSLSGDGMNELIIVGAESSDRLFASYNFFNESFAPFEGAELLPLLGAISQFSGQASFADLPQHQGPFTAGEVREDFFPFVWQTNQDRFFTDDETSGVIGFSGDIFYNRDGNDLLIHIFGGFSIETEEIGANETSYTYVNNISVPGTEVLIRIVDFQEGDLGIQFYDIGDGSDFDYSRPHGDYSATVYPNWDQTVLALTNNGVLTPPLDPRPDRPTYDPDEDAPPEAPESVIGTTSDDTIVIALNTDQNIDGLAGDDEITSGGGDDVINGGEGDDTMAGGDGDDTYIVDSANDQIIETIGNGRDQVLSSTTYTLPEFVENLTLTSPDAPLISSFAAQSFAAVQATTHDGTGNDLRNILIGNATSNTLSGLGGDDVLYGDAGDDVLIGGIGNDTYLYYFGDGNDQIIDVGLAADIDTLILEDATGDGVVFYQRADSPSDLIISLAQGGRIEILGFFDGSGQNTGVERIETGDGHDWTRADIENITSAAGLVTNEAPQAADDGAYSLRGPTTLLPSAVLLANDTDYDGDTLSIANVSSNNPDITATLEASGDIRLTTAIGYSGETLLTYTVSDGRGGTANAQVVVALYPNQAPNAADVETQSSAEDAPWSFQIPNDLYSDPDGDAITVSATLANGAQLPGWLTFDGNTETFSGLPPANFNGLLQIQLQFSDGEAQTIRNFDLVITPVNDAPEAINDQGFETNADETLVILSSDLLANDFDIDGDSLTVIQVANAVNGTVELNTDGNIVFTPTLGYTGPASFTYSIADGAEATSSATAELTIVGITEPPPTPTHTGTDAANRIVGTRQDDIFSGLAGDDHMVGQRGNDIFFGGAGQDKMVGGPGFDTVTYAYSSSAVTLTLGPSGRGFAGDADGDRLISIESAIGSAFDDIIIATSRSSVTIDGLAGDDIIAGGSGADHLTGGHGDDQLTGGQSSDTFYFGDGDGHDRILDFVVTDSTSSSQQESDRLIMEISGIDSLDSLVATAVQNGAHTTFQFDSNNSLTLENVQLAALADLEVIFL